MQTIQHCFRNLQRSEFPNSFADVAKESGREESNVYEVNQWLWRFGRGKPRLGTESSSRPRKATTIITQIHIKWA